MEGHFEILMWARRNGCPWNERTFSNATMSGREDVLEWLRAEGCPDGYVSFPRAQWFLNQITM